MIGTVLVIVSTVIFATVRSVLLVQFPLPIAIIGTWVGIYYFLFDKYFEPTFLRKKKYSFTVGGAILATPALIYAFVAFITDEGYLGIIETILLLLALVFVAFLVGAILGGIMFFFLLKSYCIKIMIKASFPFYI